MEKIKDCVIRILVASIFFGYLVMLLFVVDLHTTNKNLKNTIKEQKNLIESQAEKINKNEYKDCDCGWYTDFYYNHAAEVGAYE